jgi:hypothetical protein
MESQNCWEFMKCDEEVKKNCPAFKSKKGRECWFVAGSYKIKPDCPKVMKKYESCLQCEWFKKVNMLSESIPKLDFGEK